MTVHNQIDTEVVRGIAQLLGAAPETGRLKVRTTTRWDGGYAIEATEGELHIADQVIPRTPTARLDRPQVFGGTDTGPAPGELLLASLAACVGGLFVEHAALRGIDLEGVELTCEAHLDARGMLEIDDVRPGIEHIDIRLTSTGIEVSELDELLALAVRTSPIADSLARPVTMSAQRAD